MRVSAAGDPRAVLFDLNGTISHDEDLLYGIYAALFAEAGRPLDRPSYFGQLAGLTDAEMISTWLGPGHAAVGDLIRARVDRYCVAVADGATVPVDVRDAVRLAAGHCPVGVVSAAGTAEIETVLGAAGILELIEVIVSNGDVRLGKPHPEGYRRAVQLLGLRPEHVLAIEDTAPGLAAARAAGLRCACVLGTQTAAQLAGADEIVERLDVAAMSRLLGLPG